MKFVHASIITIAALASLAGCAASVSSSEETGQAEQASSTGGISASISTQINGSVHTSTVVVTNNGNGPATNWQVTVNMPNASFGMVNNAEHLLIGGAHVFNPGQNGKVLAAGASFSFTFQENVSGTYIAPSIVLVDGEASGTAGLSPDGVDHIARAAASGALGVAFQYENNKLANNGDPNYALYDGLIWSAQSYVISNGMIGFDPNVPGYAFIPQQAMAALAVIQQDPSVASYLVSGLASCLAQENGQTMYYFRANTLKGFPNSSSGSMAGLPGSGTGAVDTYTVTSTAQAGGTSVVTITEKTTSDKNFGMLQTVPMNMFSYGALLNKFRAGGDGNMCSPFNGPGGGTTNPYLVMSINGSTIQARANQYGTSCNGAGCTATFTVDPIAYTVPGPQYDTKNNLLGPQNNPFALDPTNVYADPSHYMNFSTNPNGQYGTFSKAMVFFGQPVDKFLSCGVSGSGC